MALDLPDGTGGTPVLLALSAGQGGVAVYLEKQREEARLGGGSRRRGSGSRAAGDGGLVATGVARWWSFEVRALSRRGMLPVSCPSLGLYHPVGSFMHVSGCHLGLAAGRSATSSLVLQRLRGA